MAQYATFNANTMPTVVFDNACEAKNNYDAAEREAMSVA
jgi:hypothetical protein